MTSSSRSFASENESGRRAEDLRPTARVLRVFTLVFEVATGAFFTPPGYHGSGSPRAPPARDRVDSPRTCRGPRERTSTP